MSSHKVAPAVEASNPGLHTVDIHTHLLNPRVAFRRPYDRIAVHAFARSLGADVARLRREPYAAYTATLLTNVRTSRHVARICLFPVDARVDNAGREVDRDPTVCAATEDVLLLYQEHPDAIIPFLSVNPLRPDALERLERYAEAGCVGAKFLQNYWCLDVTERRFAPYFERLRDLRLPLVMHLGSEFTISSCSAQERVGMLRLALECGVIVIAAHMALGDLSHRLAWWRNLSRDPRWFDRDYYRLLELLEEWPTLYADVSAMLAPLRTRTLRHLATQQQVRHKLLFGSDYPVPFPVRFNTFDLAWLQRWRLAREPNPLDRYAGVLLEYFPADHPLYTNYRHVLPTRVLP